MQTPAPKGNTGNPGFRVGSGVQKNAIKTAKLRASKLTSTQSAQSSNTGQSSDQNGNGDVAKAEKEAALAFAQTRPGSPSKIAKNAVKKTRSQNIFNQMKNGKNRGGKSPGSAYNDVNGARAYTNDMANWQALVKGSQDAAKAIADGLKMAGAGFGQLSSAVQKQLAQKKAGGGAGAQASNAPQPSDNQQQYAQQMDQSNINGSNVA